MTTGQFQGPLPKGWNPNSRYLMDRVIRERMTAQERHDGMWHAPDGSWPSQGRPAIRADEKPPSFERAISLGLGPDDVCRTCFGKGEVHGDPCWQCSGSGGRATIIAHAKEFNAGIVDRYLARAAE